jgi:CubicO group peptidase (beta-lactamase class C family)
VASASTAGGQAASAAAFTWLSEAPAVATVDAAGRVTAVSPGTAVIAATAGAVRGTVTITVRVVPVASLTLTPATADVFVGSTLAITAQPRDSASTVLVGRTITWTTDNAAVASVSGAGVVTGTASGTATITAASEGRTAMARVTVSTRPLSSIVDSVRLAWNMPAMGAAIVTLEDGVTAIAAAGTRRASGGAPVTTDDLWHLGSNTKAMTSLLAAVGVSQDRIQWTTTVAQAFPELENIRAEYRGVTLRDLLSHQSGFPRDADAVVFGSGTTAPVQRASMVTWAVQRPPASSRGTYSYSNVGYVIAAAMLERVFGMSFEAAIAAHVHAPLGMTDVGWGPQASPGSTTQPVAHSWLANGSWLAREGYDSPPGYNSSGRAHMSLTSWGRLVHEVLRVEAGASTLATAAVARQTTSEVITIGPGVTYGMGWVISTRAWASGKVLYHDGSNAANHSLTYVAPLRNVAFLATTNGYDPGGRSAQALQGLIVRLIAFHDTGR